MKYQVFIGRWQPFHLGHCKIIDTALRKGPVAIGIRNTPLSDTDPYTVEQREEMIKLVYPSQMISGQVTTFVIPDLSSINIGRKIGYEVNRIEVAGPIEDISGTAIRAGEQGDVAPEVASYLKTLNRTIFFTGLPCSGKTTLAKALQKRLENRSYRVVHLDGDVVRGRLNEDLGFSLDARFENLRRVAHLAQMFNEQGNLVLASFIAPTWADRTMISGIVKNLMWVHVDCPPKICRERDTKGMWAKADEGEITLFTGVSAPYEPPEKPDVRIATDYNTIEMGVELIEEKL